MVRSTLSPRWREPEHPEPASPGNFERTGGGRDRFHVAIIMDGNGRWAQDRGRPRAAGHVAGARAVRRTVESAPELGITTLTLYAFSSDNWRRPRGEVGHLTNERRNVSPPPNRDRLLGPRRAPGGGRPFRRRGTSHPPGLRAIPVSGHPRAARYARRGSAHPHGRRTAIE